LRRSTATESVSRLSNRRRGCDRAPSLIDSPRRGLRVRRATSSPRVLAARSSEEVVAVSETVEKAILAGGGFWGIQDLIRRRPGVLSTRVGYTGGDVANATYRNHGTHAEAIEIIFDPEVTSYRELLEFFFQIHDPTTRNRQ